MNKKLYTKAQLSWLVVLRLFIGWHFLYEGMVKVLNPHWTSLPYLLDSKGLFSSFFVGLTNNSMLVTTINTVNEWTLVLIGLALVLGCFSRLASIGGMLLLLMYTLSHPSFLGANYMMPFEGSYLWIDKNLVELAALAVTFCFPSSQRIGIDRWLVRTLPAFFRNYKLI